MGYVCRCFVKIVIRKRNIWFIFLLVVMGWWKLGVVFWIVDVF